MVVVNGGTTRRPDVERGASILELTCCCACAWPVKEFFVPRMPDGGAQRVGQVHEGGLGAHDVF